MNPIIADLNGCITEGYGHASQLCHSLGSIPPAKITWDGPRPAWANHCASFSLAGGYLVPKALRAEPNQSAGLDSIPGKFRHIARLMDEIAEHSDADRALDNQLTGSPPFDRSLPEESLVYLEYADRIEEELAKPRWDGKPENPDRPGWHWIGPPDRPDLAFPVWWHAHGWQWSAPGAGCEENIKCGAWVYHGPCPRPTKQG